MVTRCVITNIELSFWRERGDLGCDAIFVCLLDACSALPSMPICLGCDTSLVFLVGEGLARCSETFVWICLCHMVSLVMGGTGLMDGKEPKVKAIEKMRSAAGGSAWGC
jgi:hypothetical protein